MSGRIVIRIPVNEKILEIAAVDAPKFEPVILEGSAVRLEPMARAHEPLLWDVAKDHLEEIFAGFRIPCGPAKIFIH